MLCSSTRSVALALFISGCGPLGLHRPPDLEVLDLGDPDCDGTTAGHACLTLSFAPTDYIRDTAEGDLAGRLEWGLYHDGDVGLFGPGDHVKVAGTPEPPPNAESLPFVDFADGPFVVTLPELDAQAYQIIAYLDDDASGEPDDGDPVTFPSGGFDVPAEKHTQVDVLLDYLR